MNKWDDLGGKKTPIFGSTPKKYQKVKLSTQTGQIGVLEPQKSVLSRGLPCET